MAGLAAATVRGRKGGRPCKLTAKQIAMAKQLLADPGQQFTEVAKMLGVARSTLYMALRSESTAKGEQEKRWCHRRILLVTAVDPMGWTDPLGS